MLMSAEQKSSSLDLHGRTAIITGANAGLGFQTALQLGQRGARILLACRSLDRAALAQRKLQAAAPEGVYELARLDLGDLDSVHHFARQCHQDLAQLDMLCNNAGVIAVPYSLSAQNHELHMATNFFGPFALTGLLLDLLLRTPAARIVNISSQIHRWAKLPIDDLHWTRRNYKPFGAYAQSKLAVTCWTLELHRRLQRADAGVMALIAHPGFALTDVPATGALAKFSGALLKPLIARSGLVQSAADGARCSVYALTSQNVRGGDYVGPDNWLGSSGAPARAKASASAEDSALAAALWARSEEATGVSYSWLNPRSGD
jgi:NAD(P)-dependent dehydrogenase (short-subunit alcohol dehydrogenase family)